MRRIASSALSRLQLLPDVASWCDGHVPAMPAEIMSATKTTTTRASYKHSADHEAAGQGSARDASGVGGMDALPDMYLPTLQCMPYLHLVANVGAPGQVSFGGLMQVSDGAPSTCGNHCRTRRILVRVAH